MSREMSERADGFLASAVGRVVLVAGRDMEVGRVGGTFRVVGVGLETAGLDAVPAARGARGRGAVAVAIAGFETGTLGRLNIGSSKSSLSTKSAPFLVR